MEYLHYDVIVIGGGPAGLMAAGQAAGNGAHVLLLEKMEKPARKLRITGKGRCNVTNAKPWEAFSAHVFPNARFFKAAFYNFPNTALIDFFAQHGLALAAERGDRVYPASQDAWDVAGTLIQWVQQMGVEIRCRAGVLQLEQAGNRLEAATVKQGDSTVTLTASAFVVATGGLSYPATGSTGDGFRFARDTGHAIVPQRPSLVGVHAAHHHPALCGLTLRNIQLALLIDGSVLGEEFGELLFNETGLEGPVVLRLSRKATDAFLQHKKVALALNLKPALPAPQLRQRLFRELAENRHGTVEAFLRKLMPAQLIPAFADAAGLVPGRQAAELRQAAIDKTVSLLQCWKMPVTGVQGYERAVITAGGVSLDDIDHKTMRSRKVENLFFAGEVIDLDADTGGYNLQIAFSTGYLAGKMAAQYVSQKN
ncbi:MAG: NAD(P)/FAD-dependent oxidoreductase [Prevotellaceae bacterium]|nr:NAD(P)/FAD-dependent oxidoreductase [Prevotellaceae bacterium]